MTVESALYVRALERTVAEIIGRFEETPDLFIRESDLQAAFYHALQAHVALQDAYPTRDGRRTGPVHCRYPSFLAAPVAEGQGAPADGAAPIYDLVLLNPAFVRGFDFKVVANLGGQGTALLGEMSPADYPPPFLAVMSLRLTEGFNATTLDELKAALDELVQAKAHAQRAYLTIFCRHWDLDSQIRKALPTLERWVRGQDEVYAVVVQSFYDDVGRVFGGRYLNSWTHMAPLLPLDTTR